jgi:hypothetical protein
MSSRQDAHFRFEFFSMMRSGWRLFRGDDSVGPVTES